MARILVIDDEPAIRATLANILGDEGYQAVLCESAEEGLAHCAREDFDLVLLDIWLPGIDGLTFLDRLRSVNASLPVIMISGHATIDSAVRATRLGAYDFLEKPLSLDRVILTIKHALSDRQLRQQVRDLKRHLSLDEILIGESEAMKRLDQQIRTAAPTHSRILITGENGSGKEIVARQIHRYSRRSDGPFVDVNCAAIPEELIESELFGHRKGSFTGAIDDRKGKFELADRGTLFLDEIADMSLKTQAKVLRVLQEQTFQKIGGHQNITVDVRVIAATNKNLEEEIAEARFRDDLYFRLNVVPIHVPPLRERGSDIILLAEHFLLRFAAEVGQKPKRLSSSASHRLRNYPWPGNVRELRNVMERVTILVPGELVKAEDLHLDGEGSAMVVSANGGSLREAREEFEKQLILRKLRELGGNVSRTAEALGVERSNLHRKLNAYGIRVERP